MFGFGQLIEILKKDPKKIVFTEGEDPRILEAASRLLASNFLHPILVGDPEKISASAEKSGFNIRGAEIIDPMNFDRMDEMVELFCELRKSKGVTPEQAKGILSSANYFGTMLVKMGIADSLLGGATYSTADTVRPALQLIKTKPGNTIVSSCFILVRPSATGENEVLAMSDCAINIHPTEDELVEIAGESAECAKIFGIDPKVAFLSYSTLGSGKGEDVDKMRNAAHKAREKYPNLPIEGEIQFDAAVAYHGNQEVLRFRLQPRCAGRQDRRCHRLRQPGPRPFREPGRERRQRRRRPAQRLCTLGESFRVRCHPRQLQGHGSRRGCQGWRRRHDAGAR